MRHVASVVALLVASGLTGYGVRTAEPGIAPRQAAANFPTQKGPPGCSRWTDGCVSCTRSAEGEAPACSNIGVACQPGAIRCVGAAPAGK